MTPFFGGSLPIAGMPRSGEYAIPLDRGSSTATRPANGFARRAQSADTDLTGVRTGSDRSTRFRKFEQRKNCAQWNANEQRVSDRTEQTIRRSEAQFGRPNAAEAGGRDDRPAQVSFRAENSAEQELQAKEIELAEELRTERAKFEQEQAKLDELDNALENFVLQAGRP